ncbi:polysaccharide deacetylase family protein [Alteromonas sp. ASW11-130]|uniref:polysaccharide deacetylase family protein n=1 Tax=Alteromonas sp. ASW11-130 TaxID=3015775 RepID=UPI0022419DB2|nr:polysaccharide deacetylase family protein [Alteromonas sp. ASW11-130]MCW8091295.1 polysaccharide deacetylase family protein [Alteromonas sp. ASW11-130]
MKSLIKKCLRSVAGTVGWQIAKSGKKKLIILMYHRVLPVSDSRYQFEEPGMVVSDKTFRLHMQVIADENLPVITPNKWISTADEEKPSLAIAITFDDGWLDNYEFAFPVLKEFGFTSTLYVVTDYLGKPAPFWPNKILRLLLDQNVTVNEDWNALLRLSGPLPSLPMSRDDAANVILKLKRHSDKEIYSALQNIELQQNSQIEMINKEQLMDAQKTMGVKVGCHTRRHYRLVDELSSSLLKEEIVQSKQILTEMIQDDIDAFCFPNGDFCPEALKLVEENYRYAVTTKRGHNFLDNFSQHQLTRIGVHNDISDTKIKFKARLSSWI